MSATKRKATELAAAEAKKPKADGSITSFFRAPKATSSSSDASLATTSSAPAVKFNKEVWVAKLTDDQRELLQLEIDTLHDSWLAQLTEEVLSPSFLELKRFLKQEREDKRTVYPPTGDIYSWCGNNAAYEAEADPMKIEVRDG